METRLLGSSAIQVPVFVFGAWAAGGWAWGGSDSEEATRAIRESYELGANAFDTAPVYGFGDSELLVGKALQGIPRHKYLLFTKFGLEWNTTQGVFHFDTLDNSGHPLRVMRYASRQEVITACEDCLRRLRTDYIDLFQIHWPDPTTPIAETMEALELLISQGKVRAAGVSNYSVQDMEEALLYLPVASNQVAYSMVNRGVDADVLPFCRDRGVGVLVYSPMQRGLLTGKIRPGYVFGEGDTRVRSKFFKEPNLSAITAFLDSLVPLTKEKGCTLGQLVLRWTISQPGITAALVGARSADQVRQNMGALEVNLTSEDMTFISERLASLNIVEV